uniref:Uncharacterized protein n=1 Tax=Opuntia streptacantha TaxID=393608 RepID=A0A7C9DK51_OPUST
MSYCLCSLENFRPDSICLKANRVDTCPIFCYLDIIDSVLVAVNVTVAVSCHCSAFPALAFYFAPLPGWYMIFLFQLHTCLLNEGFRILRYGSNPRTSVVLASFCSIFVSLPASIVNDLGVCMACFGLLFRAVFLLDL